MMRKIIYIIWITLCIGLQQGFSQCTFNASVSKIDPVCGDNGTINVRITGDSIGIIFNLYKDNVLILKTFNRNLNVNNLTSGTYKVIMKDSFTQCIDSVINIQLVPPPTALSLVHSIDSVKCPKDSNGTIRLTVINPINPLTYQWSHAPSLNADVAANIPAGNYEVTVTAGNGCKISRKIAMYYKQSRLEINTINVRHAECEDTTYSRISVSVKGGYPPYNYFWTSPNVKQKMPLDSLKPGKYTIRFTDNLGCDTVYAQDIEVKSYKTPKGRLEGTDTICAVGGIGRLRVVITEGDTNTVQSIWPQFGNANVRFLENLGADSFSVILKDAKGCADTIFKKIELYPERFEPILGKNKMVKGEVQDLVIQNKVGLYDIVWTPMDEKLILTTQGARIMPTEPTIYSFTAKYGIGCSFTSFFEVKFDSTINSFVVPDYFTPNGDDRNEEFKLRLNGTNNIKNFEFTIFDKWGNGIFKSYDPDFSWRGNTSNGEAISNGSYRYILQYSTVEKPSETITKAGQILLIR